MTRDQREVLGSRAWYWVLVSLMAVTMVVVVVTACQRVDAQRREQAAVSTAEELATKIDQVCDEGGVAAAKMGSYCQRAEQVRLRPETIVSDNRSNRKTSRALNEWRKSDEGHRGTWGSVVEDYGARFVGSVRDVVGVGGSVATE